MIRCTMYIVQLRLPRSYGNLYKTKYVGAKKFVVDRFFEFMTMDSKIVINQVQEIQVILNEIHTKRMILSETF